MSATIYWRPLPLRDKHLKVGAPSSFIAAMERAFGPSPWGLGEGSLATLRGMSAAFGDDDRENPFAQLVELIEDDGDGSSRSIEVWTQY